MELPVINPDELTEDARENYNDFVLGGYDDSGCTCFNSPPCGWCTHPGNPRNLIEDEHAWKMPVSDDEQNQPDQPALDKSDPDYWIW